MIYFSCFYRAYLFGVVLVLFAGILEAKAAVQSPIVGEVQFITIANPSDVWSRGTMVVGGQNVIIPRNLLIDLPANRLTLQQLFAEAPPECVAFGTTGLAKADACNLSGKGATASILANRTNAGDVIAGEIMLEKGPDTVSGIATYIHHTDGFLRVNGIPGDANTGTMIRINDPTGRHTIQQGLGCAGGPNCSADPRNALDSDNYTISFATGYPACIPSTLTGGNRTSGATADGQNDPFCPHINRIGSPVANSFRFAPIQLGDHLAAEGNFELINGVHFLSVHTMVIHTALTTATGQPDYMIFDEVEWDAPGFQNDRARLLLIGFTTLGDSQLDIYSLHVNPVNNADNEFPIASTVGNPDTINQGIPPFGFGIFKIRYDVDFQAGIAKDRDSPCVSLANAGFTPVTGGCAGGATLDVAQNFRMLSPISRELIGRTRNKVNFAIGDSQDIQGNPSPNGQYLTPVGIGHPEFVEINLAAIQTPFSFEGEPWNLDRRLSPNGCVGACEGTAQPLDPFPSSNLDPRTQTPSLPFSERNRILSFYPFGPTNILTYPPVDPPAQGITPAPWPAPTCLPGNLAPLANSDAASTPFNTAVTVNVIGNDTDVDGTINPVSVVLVPGSGPTNGTAVVNAGGTVTYTPNSGFVGSDAFSYTVQDNLGNTSNVALVTITVLPVIANNPPVANADSATTPFNTPVTFSLLANDTDSDGTINAASIAIISSPSSGSVAVNTNGTVTYTPAATFAGTVIFTYTVLDNLGAVSNTATITVIVQEQVEQLAVTLAQFRIFSRTWSVTGTSSIPSGTITIYVGPTVGGTVLGTATIGATGAWNFTRTASPIGASSRISIQSSRGTKLENIPVTVRL